MNEVNYFLCVNPNSKTPLINLVGEINDYLAVQMSKELSLLDEQKKDYIIMQICSPGGSVYAGLNICTDMRKMKTPIYTMVSGIAASMATAIFAFGDKKIVNNYSQLMYHNPFIADSNLSQEQIQSLEVAKSQLKSLFVKELKYSEQKCNELFFNGKNNYYSAYEAKKLGLVDYIIETKEQSHKILNYNDLNEIKSLYENEKERLYNPKQLFSIAANLFSNQNNQNQNKINFMEISKINNALGLMDEASINSSIQAINKIKSESSEKDEEIKKMKAKMEEMEKEKTEMKAKMEEMEKEKTEMKAKMEEDEKMKAEMEEKNKAEEIITDMIKNGFVSANNTAKITELKTHKSEVLNVLRNEFIASKGGNAVDTVQAKSTEVITKMPFIV